MKRQVTSIIMQLEGEKLRAPHYPESNIVGKIEVQLASAFKASSKFLLLED
jgi:hypothetical protein